MRRALVLVLLLWFGCQKPPTPAPAPAEPPADVVVRGADGAPMLRLRVVEGVRAIVDLAGQVIGVQRPVEGGFRVTDRFDAELCQVSRSADGVVVKTVGGTVRAREVAAGVVLDLDGAVEKTLRSDGAEGSGLRIARTNDGYDVVRGTSTIFAVEGPLEPTAALALALGELPFPTRVCLMLAIEELD